MKKIKKRSEHIGGGLSLILVGLGGWAIQSGQMGWQEVLSYWPLFIGVLGVEKIVERQWMWGLLALGLSGLLLTDPWRDFILQKGWPFVLILIGAGLTIEAFKKTKASEGDPR